MTFHDNPNQRRPVARDETSYTNWIVGAVALLLIAGVMIFAFGRDDGTQTANNNTNGPSATAPANPSPPATTGQRSDPVQPTNPAGNTPTAPGSAR